MVSWEELAVNAYNIEYIIYSSRLYYGKLPWPSLGHSLSQGNPLVKGLYP